MDGVRGVHGVPHTVCRHPHVVGQLAYSNQALGRIRGRWTAGVHHIKAPKKYGMHEITNKLTASGSGDATVGNPLWVENLPPSHPWLAPSCNVAGYLPKMNPPPRPPTGFLQPPIRDWSEGMAKGE